MIFPSQLHEIAAVSENLESETLIEDDGAPHVLYDNLGHELPEYENPGKSSLPIPIKRILALNGQSKERIKEVEEDAANLLALVTTYDKENAPPLLVTVNKDAIGVCMPAIARPPTSPG